MIKVNTTLKKDLKTSKKELRSFCAQYGYENPLPPSAKQENFYGSKKKMSNKRYSKFKEESFYKKAKHKKYQNTSKKVDKEDVKCFKCGKKRHMAPNCKIKEIIVDLDVGKCLKQQMINLIKIESQSDSSSQASI